MYSVVIALVLLLASNSVCSVVDVRILNKNAISSREFESLFLAFEPDDLPANTSMCIAINGVDCYCDKLVAEIVLPAQCALDNPEISYWLALKIIGEDGVTYIVDPTFIPIVGDKSWKTQCLTNNNCLMSKPGEASRVVSHDGLTILLTLAITDISRSSVLFTSLYANDYERNNIEEFIIVVPDKDYDDITDALLPLLYTSLIRELSYNVIIMKESLLFHRDTYYQIRRGGVFPYAIQMAVKLLAAKIVQTKNYLVLDSDLILLRQLLVHELVVNGAHAIYHHEDRSMHADWWVQSETFLSLTNDSVYNSRHVREQQGFGVTPALLNTFGATLVLSEISQRYGGVDAEKSWLTCFGKDCVWSEYTLYRVVLDKYNLFHQFHTRDDSLPLYCNCIWDSSDLPFNASAAMESDCLFSVVQSTSNVNIADLYQDYIRALSRRRVSS
jgi:hypothetical protein